VAFVRFSQREGLCERFLKSTTSSHFLFKGGVMENISLLDYSGDIDLKDKFREMVAVNAYYRAEKRAFGPGHEMDDWHIAEQEILKQYRYWFQQAA